MPEFSELSTAYSNMPSSSGERLDTQGDSEDERRHDRLLASTAPAEAATGDISGHDPDGTETDLHDTRKAFRKQKTKARLALRAETDPVAVERACETLANEYWKLHFLDTLKCVVEDGNRESVKQLVTLYEEQIRRNDELLPRPMRTFKPRPKACIHPPCPSLGSSDDASTDEAEIAPPRPAPPETVAVARAKAARQDSL